MKDTATLPLGFQFKNHEIKACCIRGLIFTKRTIQNCNFHETKSSANNEMCKAHSFTRLTTIPLHIDNNMEINLKY